MDVHTRNLKIGLGPNHTAQIKDLRISSGQKVLITGPSGCGKTSLLHTLSLIKPLSAGTFDLGKDTLPDGKMDLDFFRKTHFAFVFQRLSLLDFLTAEENLTLESGELSPKARETLRVLHLQETLPVRTGLLSLGEQQRIAIARAILKQADILWMDEPTSSLDHPLANEVGELIKKSSSTLICVSHDERISKYFDVLYSWKDLAL